MTLFLFFFSLFPALPGARAGTQPENDGECPSGVPCPPGFRSSGRDGNLCVRKSYPVCRDSASRNQEGQCLTKRGWARYCSQKVCAVPSDFRGYDRVLGLCVCRSESLERVCNSQCRKRQQSTLQLSCAEKQPQLLITHGNGSKTAVSIENLRKVLPRPNFSLEGVCAAEEEIHPAHIVEMSEKGFLGVYDPDPQLVHDLVVQGEAPALREMNPPSAAAPDPPGPEECRDRALSAPNSTGQRPEFLGIRNPIACLGGNATLLFLLSPQHFPLYDVNNLYNTNAGFDWGDFRSLREEIREIPGNSQEFLLFLFQFHAPGTYVLQLSSNKHKRMYVRVMPAGAQCHQPGPFLPSTPRFAVQAGIARRREQELRLSPDWAALAAGSSALLLLLLLLLLPPLCRGLRWAPRRSPSPAFRRRQLQLILDGFSSRIPGVYSVEKPHPSLLHPAGHSCSAAGTGGVPRPGPPWAPEQQLDLDSFNSQAFLELLLRHSQAVTSTLRRSQQEARALHRGAARDIAALRRLWLRARGSPEEEEEEEEEEEQVPPAGCPHRTPQSRGFYGISDAPRDPRDSIPQKLIPLLHSVLQELQENRKINLSPASPGCSSRSTLKASAAHREASKSEENQESTQAAAACPALLPSPAARIAHLQQEMQKSPGEEIVNSLSPSELEDKVDALTEELLQIAEDEEQFLSSKGNEDLLSYYLEITSLEKESLVKQIQALEEEIAQGRKL